MAKPTREFVEDEYYDTVLGDPRLKYSQGGVYYDAQKKPIKGKPLGNPVTAEQKAAMKKSFGRVKGSKVVDGKVILPETKPMNTEDFTSTIPQVMLSAEKENQRAAQVEEQAG